MLNKKNRLTKEEFDIVFKNGASKNSNYFNIKILKTDNSEKKFAFAVSKKIIKGSIKRHFLKRRVYSIIRNSLENIPDGVSIIFFLKKEGENINFQETEKDIQNIIEKYF
ncbi:TPA: ribonuclease P protein component [Candidatus Campbellbacteria bacterium]|nr:MAG: ribonuclease P protein component, ribonuclease P protein component [Candidatus Campbellbacteria bacterium GW2011_OD1_34_28]KKP75285.1 MAG: Ribonuclease P protein component [Candidatus Campbellbacteria bacterium GW2011_GWD2_35_24]KKP76154.1 MAG: ribonuclease P protein component, ribonuclease P protein component [Candidatus Campbellbacteria bacterium GW2011_GWC2_35_28]KKP77343.1 MAG: Ribonuclease P protein component [Candidatus Campbellbacteria bacterium GW2011_GWC1_35_31]KKP79272.1 MAG: 